MPAALRPPHSLAASASSLSARERRAARFRVDGRAEGLRGVTLAGKRIGLLTASASRLGGGVFEAVAAQAALLLRLDAVPVVIALDDAFCADDAARFAGAELHYAAVRGPRFFGYAPQLGRLLDAARLDLLHLHGIWMYPSAAAAGWAARSGKPYLISPHGMLDPWITSRGRWKKALARTGYERRSWRQASAFHALTERESADIAGETGRSGSIVIANPGPEPDLAPKGERAPLLTYLGRIHPKKNIAALIAAWKQCEASAALPSGARLTIAGWGEEAHVAELKHQLHDAPDSISFDGPVFGPAKAQLLQSSRFLALPSLSEGLPMAILEAWAAGTPVLMSDNCNLPEGFANGAAIDCGTEPAAIAQAICDAFALDGDKWRGMSEAALALAAGPFSEAAIAARWEAAYASLMNGSRQ